VFKKSLCNYCILIVIFVTCFISSGCQTYRSKIADAERIIDTLEQSAAARDVEHTTLERLFESERERNTKLQKLTNDYTDSEQKRLEAERGFISNLEGISESRQDILSKLIEVTEEIRKFIQSIEVLE
jgi:acetyl-CoA carboxylase carboxyltransferase component